MKKFTTLKFWTKVRLTLASIGVGSEITLFMVDSGNSWKVFAAVCTVLAIVITNFFTDDDNNGYVDLLEK